MSKQRYLSSGSTGFHFSNFKIGNQRILLIGIILLIALVAFELFNFDTTQFALRSLLGDVTFAGIQWATILAIAFCAIDFAGLNRLFSSSSSAGPSKEAWYLMGAWLLGATMNAVMTWWAVSLTLINNGYGNEVLSREQLLRFVPIFVAALVWLTRILFIGAFTISGDQLFGRKGTRHSQSNTSQGHQQPIRRSQSPAKPAPVNAAPRDIRPAPKPVSISQGISPDTSIPSTPERTSRVRQRPPVPTGGINRNTSGLQARTHQS